MDWVKYALKAIYAAAVAFLGSLIAALQAGSLNMAAWLTIILATLVALGGVFGLTNGASPKPEQRVAAAKAAAAAAGGTFNPANEPQPVS